MFKNIHLPIILLMSIFIVLFSYIIPAFYLRYIKKMNDADCKCSKDFSRSFIKFYSIYLYTILGLTILLVNLNLKNIMKLFENNPTSNVIKIGFGFLLAYYLLIYNMKINDKNCKCANTWEVSVMKYHSYLIFVFVFLSSINIISILYGNRDFMNAYRLHYRLKIWDDWKGLKK